MVSGQGGGFNSMVSAEMPVVASEAKEPTCTPSGQPPRAWAAPLKDPVQGAGTKDLAGIRVSNFTTS